MCMERSAWTDERLDAMSSRVDSQFNLLRTELRSEMATVRGEIGGLREEMREEMREFRGELRDVRRDMFHGAIALFGSQVAILAVLLAQSL